MQNRRDCLIKINNRISAWFSIAAFSEGIVYVLSTTATCTIEEVAEAVPEGNNWFQLYIYKDR